MKNNLRVCVKRIFQRFNQGNKNQFKVGKFNYHDESISTLGLEQNKLKIKNFCSITGGLTIFAAGNNPLNQISTYPFNLTDSMAGGKCDGNAVSNQNLIDDPVAIGLDVWIGTEATIMPVVSIGHGTDFAADTHVVKNLPPNAIYGGNPAKLIRCRFTNTQMTKRSIIQCPEWNDKKTSEVQSNPLNPFNGRNLGKLEALSG